MCLQEEVALQTHISLLGQEFYHLVGQDDMISKTYYPPPKRNLASLGSFCIVMLQTSSQCLAAILA